VRSLGAPIHVWPTLLGDSVRWDPLLSADEHERAQQFRRRDDRATYIACRGLLRARLGAFLGRDPAALRFTYGAHEKPVLEDGACSFNVSRSNGLALIAISAKGPLGVDVEWVRRDVDIDALTAEFLAADERATLAILSPRERTRGFFRLWVRHEAQVKATGRGLVVPANVEDMSGSARVEDLDVGRDYAAALATDGEADIVLHPLTREPRP
jgi:4'-phosphopantetheinyl transferase